MQKRLICFAKNDEVIPLILTFHYKCNQPKL